jgi:hypothetical protein
MSTTSAAPFDQASGLRELFAAMDSAEPPSLPHRPAALGRVPTVYAFICPSRPALGLPLLQACSLQLRQLGMRHVGVDELDFDARESWPLPGPVRFDLGQSLNNHVPLAGTVQPLDDPLSWYAMARRLSAPQGDAPSLAQRLSQSGLDFDAVLVCAQPQQVRPWGVYASRVKPVLLCETDPDALALTLAWVQQHGQSSSGLDMANAAWILLGEGAQNDQARSTIEVTSQALLGGHPAWLGNADMRPGAALMGCVASFPALAKSLASDWLSR